MRIIKNKKRHLFHRVIEYTAEKMAFIGGPRQVGKTYLSKQIGAQFKDGFAYLNWDDDDDRSSILAKEFPKVGLLVLDELHKNRKWRQLLKGLYDKNRDVLKILVTGSARLDYYRFGSDSLQGHYSLFTYASLKRGRAWDHQPNRSSRSLEIKWISGALFFWI